MGAVTIQASFRHSAPNAGCEFLRLVSLFLSDVRVGIRNVAFVSELDPHESGSSLEQTAAEY